MLDRLANFRFRYLGKQVGLRQIQLLLLIPISNGREGEVKEKVIPASSISPVLSFLR
jgi:hypothetical protein